MRDSYFSADDIKAPAWDTGLVKRIWPFLYAWKGCFSAAILFVFAATAVQISLPWVLGKAVDEGIKEADFETLIYYSYVYLLMYLSFFVFSIARNWLLQYAGQKVLHDLRNRLFMHLQNMPVVFFDKNPVGRLVTRLTNDVATLAELFSAALINAVGDVFVLIGIASMMLVLNFRLGLAALATAPVLFATAWLLKVKMRTAFRLAREKLAIVNASLAENISGITVIQSFCQESDRMEKFDEMNSDLKSAELDSVFYNSFFVPTVTVVNALTLAIVIIYGGHLVMENSLSIGLLVAFVAYIQRFFEPVRRISEKVGIFQSAMASAERVFSILDHESESDFEGAVELKGFEDKIEFKNLSFAYSSDKPVLKDVSFSLKKGEKVAIVGHTGAGKTTLASLLKMFYDYDCGEILIDGKSLRSFTRSSVRRQFALIQQEVNIFSGSIKDNIFLDHQLEDSNKLESIIKELQMEKIIDTAALDSVIYERGKNLSSGQRQLIAFARAMVKEPSVLILDEATSSMDSDTEHIVQQAVKKITSKTTSLVIAHRLSTIKFCDRVLVFNRGKLTEQGTHDELIAQNGYYARLCKLSYEV